MKNKVLLFLFAFSLLCCGTVIAQGSAAAAAKAPTTLINIMFYISYFLMFITILGLIGGFVYNAIINSSSTLKSAIGLGALLVLLLIGYLMSGNEVTRIYQKFNISPGLSKSIGGGMIMSYLMLFIALGGIAYTEVIKIFK